MHPLVLVLAWPVILGPAAAAEPGGIHGRVTTTGLRTSAGIVVSLERPDLVVTPPADPAQVDQRGLRFIPHVLAVVVGTTVRFLNNDPEPHNVYSPEGRYNLGTWPTGEVRDHTFNQAGAFTQLCRVHPEMLAFVVALPTPHFAVTDEEGQFAIDDVPPGGYTLVAWSEEFDRVRQELSIESGRTLDVVLTMDR